MLAMERKLSRAAERGKQKGDCERNIRLLETNAMKTHICSLIIGSAICFSGCASLIDERYSQPDEVDYTGAAIERLNADVAQLKERMVGIEKRQELLFAEMDAMQAANARDSKDLRNKVVATENNVKTRLAELEAMRQDIIANLSKRMAELWKTRQPPAASPRSERGREHEVKTGETLSAIAAAYKVRMSTIIEANNLKNANSVRAGQKLFIPLQE